MTFLEGYGPWAVVTEASTTRWLNSRSLRQTFKNIISTKYLSKGSSVARVRL